MLEQWSETRSILVSRSENTKPIWTVHSPFCRRSIWRDLSSSLSLSITCSIGSTCDAASKSSFINESIVIFIISLRAFIIMIISRLASSEKAIFFSLISKAISEILSAWSLIRSKSLSEWSIRDTACESSSVRLLLLRRTKYVPNLSSYLSVIPSVSRTYCAFFSL